MEKGGKLIRLDDHYVVLAIDSLDSFNDVSAYDFDFLDQVLPHCTKQQLAHIERSTKKVDLSPITDKLWKGFYARDFGGKALDEAIERKKVTGLKWSKLYESKSRSFEENEKEMGEKMRRMYEREEARKQSRQVKVVMDKIACSPSNKKLGVNNQNERSTKKVDFSPIDDKFWKGFYRTDFGPKALDEAKERKKVTGLKWSEIYEAKWKSFEENEKEMGEKMRRMYEKEEARKQSRQVKVVMDKTCSPSNKKLGVNNQNGKMKLSKNSYVEKINKQYDRSLEKMNLDVYHMKRAQKKGDRSSVDLFI